MTEILNLQINLIQDDDGIAELNPDEFFNNILRTLRDAIDGNFVIQILIVRSKTDDVTFLVVYLYIFFLFSRKHRCRRCIVLRLERTKVDLHNFRQDYWSAVSPADHMARSARRRNREAVQRKLALESAKRRCFVPALFHSQRSIQASEPISD